MPPKTRVFQIAKLLRVETTEILDALSDMGLSVTSDLSPLEDQVVEELKSLFKPKPKNAKSKPVAVSTSTTPIIKKSAGAKKTAATETADAAAQTSAGATASHATSGGTGTAGVAPARCPRGNRPGLRQPHRARAAVFRLQLRPSYPADKPPALLRRTPRAFRGLLPSRLDPQGTMQRQVLSNLPRPLS